MTYQRKTPPKVEAKPKTYRDLGKEELEKLFRRLRPNTKDAVNLLHQMMINPNVSETNRLKAALAILQEFRVLADVIYDSDDLIDPSKAEVKKPAALFHLHVVDKKEDSD